MNKVLLGNVVTSDVMVDAEVGGGVYQRPDPNTPPPVEDENGGSDENGGGNSNNEDLKTTLKISLPILMVGSAVLFYFLRKKKK